MNTGDERPGRDQAERIHALEAQVEELRRERDRALAAREALVKEILPLSSNLSSSAAPSTSSARKLILAVTILLLGGTGLAVWLQIRGLEQAIAISPSKALTAAGGAPLKGEVKPSPARARLDGRCWQASPTRTTILAIREVDPLGPLALSPDGRQAVVGGGGGFAGVYDLCTDRLVHRLGGHRGEVRDVAFSRDGQHIFTGGAGGAVFQWDRRSGERLRTLRGSGAPVRAIAVGPSAVVVAAEEEPIHIYPLGPGEKRTLEAHRGWVRAVAINRGGDRLASGGDDQVIRLWDLRAGKVIRELSGHRLWINALEFSPDGRRLASAALDRRLILWDLGTGEALHRLRGHVRYISDLSFNAAGTLLASASLDRTVSIWDVTSGTRRHQLRGHRWRVNSVVFGRHDRMLATSSGDGTVRLWPIPPAVPPAAAPLPRPGPGELTLRNNTTGERLRLRVLDSRQRSIPAAIARLNHFLRSGPDDREGTLSTELLELLYKVSDHFGRHHEIQIISGFRSPQYNEVRTRQSRQVARESQHLTGTAIDFRIEGITITALHKYLTSLRAGGVGFYADSQFIHMDVGPVRRWTGN